MTNQTQNELSNYTAGDLLQAFFIKEVEFRIEEGIIDVSEDTNVSDDTIAHIAEELALSDAPWDYDGLDNFISDKLEEN